MSGYTSAPRTFRPASASVGRYGGTAVGGWARTFWARTFWARTFWARLVLMRRAAETRRELGTLNPRLLADIGLTRAEAEREAERWPWDLEPNRLPGRGSGAHW